MAKAVADSASKSRRALHRFAWVLLGFALFWLAVGAVDRRAPPATTAAASDAALTAYVTDHAGLLTSDEAAQLTLALQKFAR